MSRPHSFALPPLQPPAEVPRVLAGTWALDVDGSVTDDVNAVCCMGNPEVGVSEADAVRAAAVVALPRLLRATAEVLRRAAEAVPSVSATNPTHPLTAALHELAGAYAAAIDDAEARQILEDGGWWA